MCTDAHMLDRSGPPSVFARYRYASSSKQASVIDNSVKEMETSRVSGMSPKDSLSIVTRHYIVAISILLIAVHLYYEYCMEFCCSGEDMLVRWLKGRLGGGTMEFPVLLGSSLSG